MADQDEPQLLGAKVLLSSGTEDEWFDIVDARMEIELLGALVVEGQDKRIEAVYAPGMWMRVEYTHPGTDNASEKP